MDRNDSTQISSWVCNDFTGVMRPFGMSIDPGTGLISGCVGFSGDASESVGLNWTISLPTEFSTGPPSTDQAADADKPFMVGPEDPPPDPDKDVPDEDAPNGKPQP